MLVVILGYRSRGQDGRSAYVGGNWSSDWLRSSNWLRVGRALVDVTGHPGAGKIGWQAALGARSSKTTVSEIGSSTDGSSDGKDNDGE